jgi:hypothetical protein
VTFSLGQTRPERPFSRMRPPSRLSMGFRTEPRPIPVAGYPALSIEEAILLSGTPPRLVLSRPPTSMTEVEPLRSYRARSGHDPGSGMLADFWVPTASAGRCRDDNHWPPPAQIRTCISMHTALAEDGWRRNACRDKDAKHEVAESTGPSVGREQARQPQILHPIRAPDYSTACRHDAERRVGIYPVCAFAT